jgi:uncharacterized delta-60 repeat protein
MSQAVDTPPNRWEAGRSGDFSEVPVSRKPLSHLTPKPSRVVVVAVVASLAFSAAAIAAAGDLDPTFSGDGKQTTDFGDIDAATGVALQSNGKIVVVGVTGNSGDFALARYNPSGSLDTTFSGDGKQTTDFGGTNGDKALAVALQSDGKIVVVGRAGLGSSSSWALARYNPNGSLDPTFSGDGKQTTAHGQGSRANAVALQADGKIVAVGTGVSEWIIARYNPNGSLDPTFSGDGIQTTPFGAQNIANGVAVQSDGKLVAVGSESVHLDFALARYNANGSLDTSFSGDGKQTTDFGGYNEAKAVTLQGNKIVAVGAGLVGFNTGDFAVARYNPNGSLDPTFSGDGKQTTNFGGDDVANDVAVQADGRIVLAGVATGGATGNDFALARYNTNGSLDTSFAGGGRKRTNFGGTDSANGVALQGDGRIVAAGSGNADFALARYLGN